MLLVGRKSGVLGRDEKDVKEWWGLVTIWGRKRVNSRGYIHP